MRFGIIRFPGSNCEQDVAHAVEYLGEQFEYLRHNDSSIGDVDALVLPGGFSYGDYLRCGAIARFSPIMDEVRKFALEGGPVIGICNGFQILTEAKMLEGALLQNSGLKFICRTVPLRVEARCDWLDLEPGTVVNLPISHNEGNYVCDQETHALLRDEDRIILRYSNELGENLDQAPNGALDSIAGICNKERNVFGLMPHPERAVDIASGGADGQAFFRAVLKGVCK